MKGILTLVLGMAMAGAVAAQQPTMEEIVKKWDARRASIKCVKYEFSLTTITKQLQPQGVGKANAIPEQLTLVSKHTLIMDIDDGKYRHDIDGQEWDSRTASVVPARGATVFDGKSIKTIRYPNRGKTDVGSVSALGSDFAEIKGNFQSQAFSFEILPVFIDCGIAPLQMTDQLYPGAFHLYKPSEYADSVVSKGISPTQQLLEYELAPQKVGNAIVGKTTISIRDKSFVIIEYAKIFSAISTQIRLEYSREKTGWPVLQKWTSTTESKSRFRQASQVENVQITYLDRINQSLLELNPVPGMVHLEVEQKDGDNGRFAQPVLRKSEVQIDGSLQLISENSKRSSYAVTIVAISCVIAAIIFLLIIIMRARKRKIRV